MTSTRANERDSTSRTTRGVLGVVGLGDMGLPMVRSALDSGVDVIAFDLRHEALDRAEAFGARRADSLAELARRAGVVSVIVVDDDDVRAVVGGTDGLLAGMAPGGTIIVHSTVLPSTMEAMADQAAAAGIHVIDAPVSGGSVRAGQGELMVMCGGDRAVVEACRPLLEAFGEVRYLGALGAGQAMKLVNNMIISGQGAVIREAMRLAAGFGIDEADARQILLRSTAESWMLHNWDHLQAFYTNHRLAADREELIDLLVKDIWSAVLAGRSRRVYLPVAAMIAQTLPAMHAAAFDAANAPAED
jgi:3-hydroxyisobutyrate dehydrogenase